LKLFRQFQRQADLPEAEREDLAADRLVPVAAFSLGYTRARPAKAIRGGQGTWLATSSPKPQTLVGRVSFLGEGP
jgi:hypothetical protein